MGSGVSGENPESGPQRADREAQDAVAELGGLLTAVEHDTCGEAVAEAVA